MGRDISKLRKLFLDIETIPEPGSKNDKTSLHGEYGNILCMGIDIDYGRSPMHSAPFVISGNEISMLTRFWEIAANCDLFIGHCILDFDLPFIYKRSVINSIKPTKNLSFARYRKFPIYDTMHEWTKWARGRDEYIKMDALAQVLGIPSSKRDFTGELVAAAHAMGQDDKIFSYCADDVRVLKAIYKRMEFL